MAKFVGIKCDACSWKDMSVPRAQYPEYLDRCCPECGSPLLTLADWNLILLMEATDKNPGPVLDAKAEDIINKNLEMNGCGLWGLKINGLTLDEALKAVEK